MTPTCYEDGQHKGCDDADVCELGLHEGLHLHACGWGGEGRVWYGRVG
jgi:hypothetical protein